MADPRILSAHSLTTWTLSGWGCHLSPHLDASSAWERLSTPSMWSAAGSSRTAKTAWIQSCATTGCEWAGRGHFGGQAVSGQGRATLGDRMVWGRGLRVGLGSQQQPGSLHRCTAIV